MIKKHPKGLMALLCAVIIAFGSCKKDSALQPEATSADLPQLSSNTLATTSAGLSGISASFVLGVNGHPLGDIAYLDVPASAQIEMIKKMGMGIYRINILSTSDGTCTVPTVLQPLLAAAAAGDITLLPMLATRTLDYNDSESTAYQKGKTLGGNFAAKYAAAFNYYDMGNDLDLKPLLSGKDGRALADYDQTKLHVIAAYLKGMSEGIHTADPGAQTMISAGWLHWGFIKACESYGVNFDILAYHWYSDMEAAIARSPWLKISDITVTLNGLFPGKPIWITETNSRPKNLGTFEADQNTFLTNFIAKCKANPTVKAVLVYELFDEPYKNGEEKYYGIAKWDIPYTKWINKLVANTFEAWQSPPVVTEFLTNLVGYTSTMPQPETLKLGATYYTDRDYTITSAPAYLINAHLIKTANDDKISKLSSFVSFKISKPATVYVAYDPRATKLPGWLQGFTKATETLGIDDPKLASMDIYQKDYPAGTVLLGANLSDLATGALCQYVIVVREK
ncbi:glycosyl hydrolase [Mucilaginibacter psychrotolerans]|uniref:Asl1-like glycosyl hydrolase catalytic domain-containing protein n=1 Tax=Mucilaginibacter psychrotolerans TaxID=1524096 RepID=A0A4Y8RZF1_9SPHI|nr:glycosyl hydrolase [Mucilaginibacter psychrotolerans]TFF30391.1 hypothetical protein E2R66_27425 [Mucilaginibacter psychrotolerans]